MWHNISLRNILDENVYLQDILSAWTAVVNLSKLFINRIYKKHICDANHAHIDAIFLKRIFQKHAWSVIQMISNPPSLNNSGRNAELSTTVLHPLRSIMNDNAHVNRRAAQGRDSCRSCIRE